MYFNTSITTCKFLLKTMRVWTVFYFIVSISVGYAKAPKNIVGGCDVTNIRDYPFQVSLRVHGQHICGGAIIDHYHIITAASCVVIDNGVFQSNLKILSGTIDQRDSMGQIHNVTHIVVHEDYDPENFWHNDIALLTVSKSIRFSPIQRPVPPLSWHRTYGYVMATGWGGSDTSLNTLTRYLQRIEMKIETIEKCRLLYYGYMILIGSQKCATLPLNAAISKGDGGSPLSVGGKVLGLLSLAEASRGTTAIFTRLFPYISWINQSIHTF